MEELEGEIAGRIFGRVEALMIVEYSNVRSLLNGSGHGMDLARSEENAIQHARCQTPDLILMSLDLDPGQLLAGAYRTRQQANLSRDVAIVILCVSTIPKGADRSLRQCLCDTAGQLQPSERAYPTTSL